MGKATAVSGGDNDGGDDKRRSGGISGRGRSNHGFTYRVLVGITNDANGKEWQPGDIVTAADFPAGVIDNWLDCVPPVLEVEAYGS